MVKYKLAFVIERYFEFGGLQRDMRRFALACAQSGHSVTVFTSQWDGPNEPMLNVQIIDFRKLSNHGTMKKLEDFVLNLRQKKDFDCIVGFNRVGGLGVYFGGDVCLRAKLQQRGRLWRRFLPRYRSYLQLEEAVFGPGSDAELMLISPVEAKKYQHLYHTASERIHLLPPGIDRARLTTDSLAEAQRDAFREELGVSKDGLLLLTVGSGFYTKGIDRAIHAIAGLAGEHKKRCRYIVVGQGKERRFKAIAQKLGIGDRVSFVGGRRDVPTFYHAADLLIHPARTENTGTTLLEAMVTGLPVLATDNCGYAHYIQSANAGALCPEPFEQAQLNTLLGVLLADDRQRQQYGKNGSEYCRTAEIYSMAARGAEIIIARAKKNRGGQ